MQWLDRVKFGNGKDGAPATDINTNSGQGWGTVTGTAGQTTLSITDVYACWRITAGDVILIHQSQGTGAGQWELNVASETFPNSTTATKSVKYPLAYNYGVGAQVIRVPQWTGGTLSGNATTAASWNGSYGGIYAVMCNGDLTISGTINTSEMGFRGGYASGQQGYGQTGESYAGTQSQTGAANYSGGGGGKANASSGSYVAGSPGGNGAQGTGSVVGAGSYSVGTYGGTSGNAGLTSMVFGGGSGGGGGDQNGPFGAGVSGAGIIVVIAKTITITGTLTANGKNGTANYYTGGSGGAGGSILIKCQSGTLGTSKVLANGGTPGVDNGHYGATGGAGRIHIDYYSGYTGTTTPTIDSAQDTNLKSDVYTSMI